MVATFATVGVAQPPHKMTAEHSNLPVARKAVSTAKVEKQEVSRLPMLDVQKQMKVKAGNNKATRRLMSNGIFYSRPVGTLYGGFDVLTGSGYYSTILVTPMMTPITFVNKCIAESSWLVNGNDVSENVVEGNYVDEYTKFSDGSAGMFYAPTVATKDGSYTLGEYNVYKINGYTSSNGIVMNDSLTCLYPADPNAAINYNGQYYSPFTSWGLLNNDNLFGSGKYEEEEGYGTSTYCVQVFDKPISPLFLTKIVVDAVSTSQPIPAGEKVRALITKVKTVTKTYRSGETAEIKTADLDNVIDVLYAEASDTLDFVSSTTRNGKKINTGYVVYQKPGEQDIFGNEIPGNVVVDDEFAVVITDLDKEGMDYGISGLEVEECDDAVASAELYFDGGKSISYSGTIALNISLYGMYDKVVAPEHPNMYTFEDPNLNYSIVTVPVEGSPDAQVEYGCGNMTYGATATPFAEGAPAGASGWPGVPVFTNVSWFDQDNNVNYDLANLPDWITNFYVDDSFGYGCNNIMFYAEPLPDGMKGRYAIVYVIGQQADMNGNVVFSAVSEPIAVVQGEVDNVETLGIKNTNVKTISSDKFYNLMGQQTTKATKGIVIRDGKKFFAK